MYQHHQRCQWKILVFVFCFSGHRSWLRRGGRMQTSGITDLIEASPCNDASKKALACELTPCKRPFTASASVQNAISHSDSTLRWHPT